MKRYKFLLFDVDDTLLDFQKGANYALTKALLQNGLREKEIPEAKRLFEVISAPLWEKAEKGVLTVQDVAHLRFDQLFAHYDIDVDGKKVDQQFRDALADDDFSIDGAKEVLAQLSKEYPLYVVSNGMYETQEKRLKASQLYDYFDARFTSSEIGVSKPARAFFDHVATHIPSFDPSQALVIGDSLTSDMTGGIQYGIDTCWFNPDEQTTDLPVTYTIQRLEELYSIVK